MNTYLVTLADRTTGEDQRILVQSSDSDGMQEFVDSDEVRPTLRLITPVVIAIHQLRVKRPPQRTNFVALEKTPQR
jgi:hypothetical protein